MRGRGYNTSKDLGVAVRLRPSLQVTRRFFKRSEDLNHDSHLSSFSRPCQHRAASTVQTGRDVTKPAPFPPAYKSVSRVSTKKGPVRPPPSSQNDADSWIAILDLYLPPDLRNSGETPVRKNESFQLGWHALTSILLGAQKEAGVNVLTDLVLRQRRQSSAIWIINVALKSLKTLPLGDADVTFFPSVPFPKDTWLDKVTSNRELTEDVVASLRQRPRSRKNRAHLQQKSSDFSLAEFTAGTAFQGGTPFGKRAHEIMGMVWETAGHLSLAAADQSSSEAAQTMSTVRRIIAKMHDLKYIPSEVFMSSEQAETFAIQQPPPSYIYSTTVLPASHRELKSGGTDQRTTRKLESNNLEPELSVEFILWCCLHGGWLTQGTSLISYMKRRYGAKKWSLVSWRDVLASTDQRWREIFDICFSDRGLEDEQFSILVSDFDYGSKRGHKISSEVIVAYVDSLLNSISHKRLLAPKQSAKQATSQIELLKSMLVRDKMSLGISTWDTIIARFVQLPDHTIESHPRLMEVVFSLAEAYGKELEAKNCAAATGKENASTAAYLFDGSAAILGFYHRTLSTYIGARDVNAALRVLAHLQSHTDNNKERALEDFFHLLGAGRSLSRQQNRQGFRPRQNQFPSFFPTVPDSVMAGLLDLATEAGMPEIGMWLIHSEDADGPSIPEEKYNNQSLAPALIRFATENSDSALLAKLNAAQNAQVSARTLVAVCESRIKQTDWKRALHAFNVIQEYSLLQWSSQDLAIIIRALVPHISSEPDSTSAQRAAALLQKLLRGDLGQLAESNFRQLDSLVGVLSSMDQKLAGLCSNLLIDGHYSAVDLPIDSFNTLLEAASKAYGSNWGKHLWDLWCEESRSERDIGIPVEAAPRSPRQNIAELFSGVKPSPNGNAPPSLPAQPSTSNLATFTSHINPNITTLRIIVQQARSEIRQTEQQHSPRASDGDSEEPDTLIIGELPTDPSSAGTRQHFEAVDVLHWAGEQFLTRFNLKPVDINEELEGHVPPGLTDEHVRSSRSGSSSATTSSSALVSSAERHYEQSIRIPQMPRYSFGTLRAYRALCEDSACKAWALEAERRLQRFSDQLIAAEKKKEERERVDMDQRSGGEEDGIDEVVGHDGLVAGPDAVDSEGLWNHGATYPQAGEGVKEEEADQQNHEDEGDNVQSGAHRSGHDGDDSARKMVFEPVRDAERKYLHSLVQDFGTLKSEDVGEFVEVGKKPIGSGLRLRW
ncbi:MAG: hypothetical protein M1831_007351 [Alyxoria varia]|nr:MAG: hypothetical protein M1831_007351 [Alyxoria varia]